MSNDESIKNLVREAKEATIDLDEPYRMEAFKIVLERLLSGVEAANPGPTGKGKSRSGKKTSKKKTSKKKTSASEVTSSLNLSTKELQALKAFYQRYNPAGGEMCAFILSIFIHETISIKQFNEADIESLYRSLISMKVKVPAVSDWKRALNWLCAKSRKKEWLKRNGITYEVTNAGLIAFNELDEKKDNG